MSKDNTQRSKDLVAMQKGYQKFLKYDTPTRLISSSVVKRLVKSMGLNVSGDFADAAAKKVFLLITESAVRCYDNNRKTVRPCDL
jgi:hypothetical protein